MTSGFKKHLLQQLYILCRKQTSSGTNFEIASHLKTIKLGSVAVKLPLKIKQRTSRSEPIIDCDIPLLPLVPNIIEKVTAAHDKSGKILIVESNPQNVMKDILESDPTALSFKKSEKKVIIEYSSPNITKPFHTGHLRSTIIGNVIANVKKKLGENVVRINYLGDWGTQFGLLSLGIKLAGYTDEALKENPIELLFEAYVKANKQCEENPELMKEALKICADLEEGDNDALEMCNKIREWTVAYLKNMYGRLGIHFDEYHWESSYRKKEISGILDKLNEKNLLVTDDKNRVCVKLDDKIVPLVKSDGSTLYLARDIAAVYDRRLKHQFEQMYYIVEDGQSEHFNKLFAICEKLGFNPARLHHVKFERIQGLSTRRGNVVFIKDVFDEAKALLFSQQEQKITSKIHDESMADIVGMSSVVINDLKQKKEDSYKFDWESACKVKTSPGIRLQYAHCRLHNLIEAHKNHVAVQCDPKALKEPSAIELASEISKYEEKIIECDLTLEPCALVQYLLRLAQISNGAYNSLNVRDVDSHTASQRLLLFNSCKRVLEDGLKLLGLRPLEKM